MMHVKVGMDGDLPMRVQEPGTYEWWYFDAIDESQELAITIIFFDGMPMSPYWLEALPNADSREYSGYAVSLYRRGKNLPDSCIIPNTMKSFRIKMNCIFEWVV